LEFGGNVLPYIENEEECLEYGEWFKAQIKMLRRLNPNSAFLIIGPADASVKVKTDYITHPFLETVRDVMLQAAKDTGCMYWDMYEVMGGKNSMPQWVGAKPPLAAPDYIHFSRLGAQKMAEIFVEKLFGLYESYKQPQAIVPSAGIQNLKNDVH
jgi:lysophospholipase L1-like esterase